MKKILVIGSLAIVAAAAAYYFWFNREPAQAADVQAAGGPAGARGGGAGGRGQGGGGFGGGGRGAATGPLTVEVATASKSQVESQLMVVGNLIGDATVSVVPRVGGRMQDISVRLGDAVRRGQRIAKIEDFELQEQLKQQEAALQVSQATIRQREADLQLAQTNAERSRNLFARQLLPKQTLDDTEARYQAAEAQLDLARAQNTQSTARLEELRIQMQNTVVVSPVNGFVSQRTADPGAFVSQNAPIVEVVAIDRVRLVANIVEKDLNLMQTGDPTQVEVDAYPGEMFEGRIARVSPVLDPSTRTAPIEVEIPNPGYRLKPGMYARVRITTDQRKEALVVPSNAVVDFGGRRGVFVATESDTVLFRPVTVGIENNAVVEVLKGVEEGERVVTTGAGALRDGDRVIVARTGGGRGTRGRGEQAQTAPGAAPVDGNAPAGRRGGGGRRGQGGAAAPANP
jgi:RND family efflux transporter MFP subunit